MAKPINAVTIGIRPTADDLKLLEQLRSRLGVEVTQIIRVALRELARKEGLRK